ncbi:MAG: OsmC family protein [Acidobacteria bacterium]|nr:OsmC family protein [Acidobacteriota bacterium]
MLTNTVEKTQMVNGINIDDVMGLIGAVQDNPDAGETRWSVSSAWLGGTRNRATVRSFHIGGEEIMRPFTMDVDEPLQLGGTNTQPNPQEYLLAALNACMIVGYAALCSLEGITLDKLEIATSGNIDLRGFLGIDPTVNPGYDSLTYTVNIKGDGTPEQFEKIHRMVQATSPNFANISRAVALNPTLVVE